MLYMAMEVPNGSIAWVLTPEQHAKRLEVRDKLRALKRINYYALRNSTVQ